MFFENLSSHPVLLSVTMKNIKKIIFERLVKIDPFLSSLAETVADLVSVIILR